jgi:hypothetical protein
MKNTPKTKKIVSEVIARQKASSMGYLSKHTMKCIIKLLKERLEEGSYPEYPDWYNQSTLTGAEKEIVERYLAKKAVEDFEKKNK